MRAAILNYKKYGGHKHKVWRAQTQNVAKTLVFSLPKRIAYKEMTSPHIYLWDVRENFRMGRKKASREFNYLKLLCPKFKRGRQMANVTTKVWSRASQTCAVTRILKPT